MAGRYLKIYADFRESLTALGDAEKGRRWRRSKIICRRKAEMNKKNIENPLTIEQLREMVEDDREGDAP